MKISRNSNIASGKIGIAKKEITASKNEERGGSYNENQSNEK